MHHPQPLSWKIRLAIFVPLIIIGSLPLFIYFQFEHESILLLMWLTLIVVQFVLSIRTARLAIGMMAGVRKRDGKRCHLDMTPDEAKHYPRKVLIDVFRATWVDHVMLVLPRLGVALGFTQNFFCGCNLTGCKNPVFIIPKRYFSYSSTNGNFYSSVPFPYPELQQAFILLCVLIVLAILINLFTIALGVFCGVRFSYHNSSFTLLTAWLSPIIFAIFCLGLLAVTLYTIEPEARHRHISVAIRQGIIACNALSKSVSEDEIGSAKQRILQNLQSSGRVLRESGECETYQARLFFLRSIAGVEFTMLTLIDNGVFLGSNILRPVVDESRHHEFGGHPYFGYYRDENWEWQSSYIPFVFRNILSAFLVFGVYGVMIMIMLRIASQRLVRNQVRL